MPAQPIGVGEYREELTVQRLRELLDYDPETGVFTWRVRRGGAAVAGSVAGSIRDDGYRDIKVDGPNYMAQRLAWLYMTGSWPTDEIDHKNCVRADNWWENLREATHSQNTKNALTRRDNTSGFKGVSFYKRNSRWQARIKHAGRQRHLGYFDTAAEAHAVYRAAATAIDPEFARFA